LAATRIGQLIIEDWKSAGGAENYNPEDLQMGFSLPAELSEGTYMTTVDGLPLYITMDYEDVATDAFAGVTLRKIAVAVHWKINNGHGVTTEDDPGVVLATYVRRDQ
jgi:hypothetical protein